MEVQPIRCWVDNYAYVVYHSNKPVALVDPIDPDAVCQSIAEKLNISDISAVHRTLRDHNTVILTTHHHDDHSSGNEPFKSLLGDALKVYGFHKEGGRIPALNCPLKDGEEVQLSNCPLKFKALHTPPHTSGHICYYFDDGEGAVFTGDCLFVAGSGYINEGTPAEMYESLMKKLHALPDTTKVYVGHEYTVSNLKFATHIEPSNEDMKRKLELLRGKTGDYFSVPSTIGEEKLTNPFMRVDHEAIQKAVGGTSDDLITVMGKLREAKNNFKPPKN
ncbi:hypothetical protein MP228_007811 [Amoeboaphelidium protococcarum]|nr:hypothetical protein MP228_007811 [Amoeboaphelidium protococcarum]